MLVTIEGISGSGKTTLIENLKPLLEDLNPIYTSEPYGKMQENIENVKGGIYKTAIYSLLSHIEHLERLIEPKRNNNLIISDCFFDNIIAVQSKVQQLDLMKLIEYQKKVSVIPDLTILLTCNPDVAYKRLSEPPAFDTVDFLQELQENFVILAKMRKNVYVFDTTELSKKDIAFYANNIIKTYNQNIG